MTVIGQTRPANGGTRRVALLVAMLAITSWVAASWLLLSLSGNAGAAPDPRFRHTELMLVVPDQGQWWNIRIGMFVLDEPGTDFAEAAGIAREEMLARFPGAVEIGASGDVSAQFVLNGYSWTGGSTTWAYDATGKPGGLSGDAQAMANGANAWNGIGANWMFAGGGGSTAGTGACQGSGGRDGQNTVGWGAQSGSTPRRNLHLVLRVQRGRVRHGVRPRLELDHRLIHHGGPGKRGNARIRARARPRSQQLQFRRHVRVLQRGNEQAHANPG